MVDGRLLVDSIKAGESFGESGSLSLAQWCEAFEASRVLAAMDNNERLHIKSNSCPGNGWVRATPLTWINWEIKPRLWVVALRRRLYQRIAPRADICGACQPGRVDIRGEHQVTCAGRGGLIMRHC